MTKYQSLKFELGRDKAKSAFLDRCIFFGLNDINSAFDAPSVKYFSEVEFEIVLRRVNESGLGISGLEPWKDNEYYDCRTFEEFGDAPADPNWYMNVFDMFKIKGDPSLQLSASYVVTDELLEQED